MRLTNLIVLVWRYRQEVQRQYEDALPQTTGHNLWPSGGEELGKYGESIIVPDGAEEQLQAQIDKMPRIRQLPEQEYIYSGDIVKAPDKTKFITRGIMPPGGRRHNGVLAFEWLSERLKKSGIDIGIEDSEYAALDQDAYSEQVADLSAELLLENHDLSDRIASDREWVKAIEERPDNEVLAEQLLDELGRQFSFIVDSVPVESAMKVIEFQPVPTDLQIPTVMPASQETVEAKR